MNKNMKRIMKNENGKETKLHKAMLQRRRCERKFQKANLVWLGWLKVDSLL